MTSSSSPIPAEPIEYGRPAPKPAARVWAGVCVMLAGLALLVIGGCFLIGVMLTETNGFSGSGASHGAGQIGLIAVLYILAFAAFAAGIWVFVIGMRGLLRIMNGM